MAFLQQGIPQREKDHTAAAVPAAPAVPAKMPSSAAQDRPATQEEVPRWAGGRQDREQEREWHLRGRVSALQEAAGCSREQGRLWKG